MINSCSHFVQKTSDIYELAAIQNQSLMRKFQVGKLYSFKFPKRKSEIQGIVLDFNDEWTLLKRAYDYSTDGFTVFKNEKVEYIQSEYEKFAAKILKAKKLLTFERA